MKAKTKKILLISSAVVLVGSIAGIIVYKNKEKQLPASGTATKNMSGSEKLIVGPYDPANDRTWIYKKNNFKAGFYVKGKVAAFEGKEFSIGGK